MPNLHQPQGVTLTIEKATGLVPLEFIEDRQTTLPNIINLTGEASNAKLTLNDGLLRTHQDVIHINFGGGTARLHILKTPITNAAKLNKENVAIAFDLDKEGEYTLQRLNGEYILTHATSVEASTF